MRITPKIVIADLEDYIKLFDVELSEDARKTVFQIENFCCQCNNPSTYEVYLSKLIKNVPLLREMIKEKGFNPDFCSLILEKDYYTKINMLDKYGNETSLYSRIEERYLVDNAYIVDCALDYCIYDGRNSISNEDMLLGFLDAFQKHTGQIHGTYTDKVLNTGYYALFHILGEYREALNIKFDDIRFRLNKKNIISFEKKQIS